MTQLSLSARLARVTALRSVIDASGGGKMLFCAGTMPAAPEDTLTAIVLATMPLATPACGTVSESPATVATLSLTPASVLAASAEWWTSCVSPMAQAVASWTCRWAWPAQACRSS